MIHFLPLEPATQWAGPGDGEMLARIAGLRRALRVVEPFAGGPASDFDEELDGAAFAGAGAAVKRCFDHRSERVIGAAAAGLDAVVSERSAGRQPHDAALARLGEEIRAGLQDLTHLLGR